MINIHINDLQQGMVLADAVKDVSGRLLLAKGKTIQPDHLRIFKIWGVTDVSVRGNYNRVEENSPQLDLEQIERIKEYTLPAFRHTDIEHPAIKEIFRLSVLFRYENKFFGTNSNVRFDIDSLTENVQENNSATKLSMANITLPEVPSIVFELNEVIANPLSSAADIAQVVQKSPSLTAILLKIVNSPICGFPSKIDKISHAVTLIGTREITGLALGVSILSSFNNIPQELLDMYSFLKHSFACGIITRVLAAHKRMLQTEQLFISGLIHDIGRLIMYYYFPEDSRNILGRSRTTNILLYEIEKEVFDCNHSQLAKDLIQQWKLPISLENNVFYHHNPSEAQQTVPATLVHLADIITNGLGIGTSGECFVPPLDGRAWEGLGLSPSCFDLVVKQATHQIAALENVLNM